MPEHEPYLDPITREWIFPDGTRLSAIMGAAPDDDDDDDVGDMGDDDDAPSGDAQDDDDDDDDDEPDWDPPNRIQWEKMQDALKRYRRETRSQKREYEEKIKNLSTGATAEAAVEIERTRIETEQKTEKKWLKRTVQAEAAKLLVDAGASASTADRLAKLVDLDKITYDERDGELDGLEDEIDDIVNEHSDLFKPKEEKSEKPPRTSSRPRVDGASRGGRPSGGGSGGRQKQSSAERIAAGVLGRAARARRSTR